MKKNVLMSALGESGDGSDSEVEADEGSPSEEASDQEEDDAIDTALDPESDPETRRAAFRRAVELCGKY